ncbi:hypothetical protein K4K49_008245 [Colletotrichum sp. SAR 10_70]|nr:hypothetical protein K4K49_008245 [Colletotrichum sp. SAR 10_70]KAI8170243.1 hypothetical protein K4K50_009577 [Colletotrichum sp. SAR 10_71]KAI8191776.1 hypothetical protein K4K51_009942 [Colletotrichum sp. SAR 10_75]
MSSIPSITVTSPEGTTFSAFALPFPVDAATLPEIDGSFAPPANESMASGEGLSDKFDIMTISDIFEREATKIEFKREQKKKRPAPKPNADDKENVAPSPLPKKPKADLPSTTNTPVPMMLEKPEPLKNAFEKMAKATGAPKKTTKKSAASKKPLSAGQKTIQDFFSR